MEKRTNVTSEESNTRENQTVETTINRIIDVVCEYYGLTREQLLARPNSSTEFVTMRHIAIYLCTEYTSDEMDLIGKMFGYRNHASVIHGRVRVKRMMIDNECIQDIVASLRAKIA